MSSDPDREMMRRAIELAMRGRGGVEPNPMVGCVIARQTRIIGQGWHQRYGGPHAEVEALRACDQSPQGATVYVTLEPCCHTNKQTPPCAPQLIAAKVGRVVVGCVDPNPAVSGGGLELLRAAGIPVEVSVLEQECRQLIAPFTARVAHRRPYVTLKWAQSADGKVAGAGGRRVQISNEASMRQVHALRGRSDAILVGSQTAVNDDPMLTARHVAGARPLIRVVLDTRLRLREESQLARTAGEVVTWVYCSEEAGESKKAGRLGKMGVITKPVMAVGGHVPLPQVLGDLASAQVTHLVVEPGPTLAGAFLEQNLADRTWVFHSPKRLEEAAAPSARAIDWPISASVELAGDRLVEHLNPQSPVFFHLDPSADAVMASAAQ